MSGNSLQYSDLEVVSSETRPSDPGIQVKVEPGIILAAQHYDLELAHSVQSSDGDTVGVMRAELMSKEEIIEKKKWNVKTWSRRKWLLVVVLVMTLALIIIIASVIPASSKPTTSSTSESTSTLALTSGSVTSSTTQSTATKAPTSNLIRNIAAVSYTSDSVNTTRLYYQDNSGQLIEAITSNSSSSTTPTWTTNKLNYTANNGSAIAAAVTKPGLEPMEITLVFVGSNNILHSISSPLNTSASTSWTSGSVSQQNISVYSATRLATLYNPCLDCDYNIIVAYQTFDGNIVIGNQTSVSTSANPSTSIDTTADTNAGDNSADSLGSWNTNNVYCVQLGTGLAFQNKTNKANNRASLFWQWEGVNITASDWYPGTGWSGTAHWLSITNPSPYPPLTPITTGSTPRLVQKGDQAWTVVLTICSTGIRVDVFGGEAGTWILIDGHPEGMSNSTGNGKVYKDVTVTDLGVAFVVTNNGTGDMMEMWRLGDDLVSWEGLGMVDLDGAWE